MFHFLEVLSRLRYVRYGHTVVEFDLIAVTLGIEVRQRVFVHEDHLERSVIGELTRVMNGIGTRVTSRSGYGHYMFVADGLHAVVITYLEDLNLLLAFLARYRVNLRQFTIERYYLSSRQFVLILHDVRLEVRQRFATDEDHLEGVDIGLTDRISDGIGVGDGGVLCRYLDLTNEFLSYRIILNGVNRRNGRIVIRILPTEIREGLIGA